MNQQETYNTIKTHLLTQNMQARNEKGFCMYRTADGLKCAIGCLIPDELYSETLEGASPGLMLYPGIILDRKADKNRKELWIKIFKALEYPHDYISIIFLQELQNIHDKTDPKDWEENLTRLAINFELQP